MKVAKIQHAFVILKRIVFTKVSLCLQINGKQNPTFQFSVKLISNKMHKATFKLVLNQRKYVNRLYTGGKPRNYHEIVLTQICSQATSGTRRGSFQAENWIKKGWCHVHFCFILQLRTNNGEIRQCSSV